ncbi:uncharacterized protein LOC123549722 isoform X1 [Mercenaria mercenaria]|uniref:uncharacterized protein LOC123549722 isoform X1 n=1 Tax=Mercenaria mercenaria TaxID=6596 RepID=UPI00234E848D|nr:uncharacterized protein LOC123549722 isoform X1 [Mercenaria mercenaria]
MLVAAVLFGTLIFPRYIHAAESCNHYENVTKPVQECRLQEGTLHFLPELSIGGYSEDMVELTKSEFVEDIESYCSNVIPKYKECIRASSVLQSCGNSEDIAQLTTDWLPIYCSGEHLADWLKEYVTYGFNYKHACGRNNITFACYFNLTIKGNQHKLKGDSIKEYSSWAKRLTTDWFACTVDKMPQLHSLYPQCTTAWQDVLLIDWLSESVYYNPGLRLYPAQMAQILALKKEAVKTV